MLCIFKTPLDPHPDVPGKLIARRSAGDCQAACHTEIAICEHDPTVQHRKEGRYLLNLDRHLVFLGQPLTPVQAAALQRNPDLTLFDEVSEQVEVVSSDLDIIQREVIISPSCVKSDGTPITIDDFPDNWSFGNGVTVAGAVAIRGSRPCILSWVVFPDLSAPAVRASYNRLLEIMET